MREHALNLKAWEVRAILEGRKTQTRRIVKPQPQWFQDGVMYWRGKVAMLGDHSSPYGTCGDRLWVRETWAAFIPCGLSKRYYKTGVIKQEPIDHITASREVIYQADGQDVTKPHPNNATSKWRPSTQMPRWASRILLEVTDVRVERLNEIGHDDALAEGVIDDAQILKTQSPGRRNVAGETSGEISRRLCWPQRRYAALWESAHGSGSWDANPFVWVVSFRRIEQEARAA